MISGSAGWRAGIDGAQWIDEQPCLNRLNRWNEWAVTSWPRGPGGYSVWATTWGPNRNQWAVPTPIGKRAGEPGGSAVQPSDVHVP